MPAFFSILYIFSQLRPCHAFTHHSDPKSLLLYKKPRQNQDSHVVRTDRFFIHDFFVFLQDKSCSDIITNGFRESNIPETQGSRHDLFSAFCLLPSPRARNLRNQLVLILYHLRSPLLLKCSRCKR